MIPLTLKRVPQETAHDGKKSTHYPLMIDTSIKLAEVQRLATIDPTKALLPASEITEKDLLLSDGSVIDAQPGEIKEETAIPTGVDDEIPFGEEPTEAEKRKTIIKKMLLLFEGDKEKCKMALKANGYKSSSDIPASDLDSFMAKIQTELDSRQNG